MLIGPSTKTPPPSTAQCSASASSRLHELARCAPRSSLGHGDPDVKRVPQPGRPARPAPTEVLDPRREAPRLVGIAQSAPRRLPGRSSSAGRRRHGGPAIARRWCRCLRRIERHCHLWSRHMPTASGSPMRSPNARAASISTTAASRSARRVSTIPRRDAADEL